MWNGSTPIPRPVHWPRPVNNRAPTPLETRHGRTTSMVRLRSRPRSSRKITTATRGLPKMADIAAAAPAAATMATAPGSSPILVRLMARRASPPPIAISGASGPTTAPPTRLAAAASTMPGSVFGAVVPPAEPRDGNVTAVPGQVLDRQRHQHAGHPDRQDRPPGRQLGVAEVVRPGLPDQVLELVDSRQETERRQRERDAEQGHDQQQHEIAAVVQPGRGRSAGRHLGNRFLATHPGRLLDPGLPPTSTGARS